MPPPGAPCPSAATSIELPEIVLSVIDRLPRE